MSNIGYSINELNTPVGKWNEKNKNFNIIIDDYILDIKKDITPYESTQLSVLLTLAAASFSHSTMLKDYEWFINEHKLNRHFKDRN